MVKRTVRRGAATRGSPPAAHTDSALGLDLDDLVGYNLRRAHGVQKQRFAAVFAPHDIRPITLSALGTIYDHPGIGQSELGQRLSVQRANLVPLLTELETRGLIVRRPSLEDRRAHVISLTAEGHRFTKKMLALHRSLEDDLVRQLGTPERAHLLQLLKKFRRLADPELPEAED